MLGGADNPNGELLSYIIGADIPGLLQQTHRKIMAAAVDGAYDPRLCHDELRRKKISALTPSRKGAGY